MTLQELQNEIREECRKHWQVKHAPYIFLSEEIRSDAFIKLLEIVLVSCTIINPCETFESDLFCIDSFLSPFHAAAEVRFFQDLFRAKGCKVAKVLTEDLMVDGEVVDNARQNKFRFLLVRDSIPQPEAQTC